MIFQKAAFLALLLAWASAQGDEALTSNVKNENEESLIEESVPEAAATEASGQENPEGVATDASLLEEETGEVPEALRESTMTKMDQEEDSDADGEDEEGTALLEDCDCCLNGSSSLSAARRQLQSTCAQWGRS